MYTVQHAHAAVAKINNFFNVSLKRVELLKRIIQIRSGPNHKQKRARLITLCVTRFTERHLSVKLLRELLPFVVLAVEQLMTWQSLETKKKALKGEGWGPWGQIMENEFEYLTDRGGYGDHLAEKFLEKYCS